MENILRSSTEEQQSQTAFSSKTRSLASAVCLLLASTLAGLGAPAAKEIRFNRDIRPILSDNCFLCHGPDKNQRKAKLRLDIREVALEKEAFVPGKPDESELIKRIYATSEDDVMPPPDSHKQLSAHQKELLKQWIAGGAQYEPHWAYIKPVRPEVPKTENKSWAKSPVDAFILSTLEGHKIRPSREAEKRTLLRRLSLDLTGLPPTPEEVAQFVADKDPKAYERQVDRLLASPHYGERMAVPWLDVVRFADTVGYHGDQNQNIFPYRDYVINSFNQNKPFDQFTIEQLAGDLLPNATVEQKVATGFNRLNMMTREGGAQPKEYLAKYAADRVRTVSTAWMGSTLACAECHDHKFDPFSAKDFYQLSAFFSDVKQWGVYQSYGYTPNPDLEGWSNDHPFPPELEVESPYLQRRLKWLEQRNRELQKSAATKIVSDSKEQSAFEAWCQETAAFLRENPSGWSAPTPTISISAKDAKAGSTTTFAVENDGRVVFDGKSGDAIRINLPLTGGWLSAIRVELLPHPQHGDKVTRGDSANTSIRLSAELQSKEVKKKKLSFYYADADHKEERYANGFAIIGVKDEWRTSAKEKKSPQTAIWLLDQPMRVEAGDTLSVSLGNSAVGAIRVSISPVATKDPLKTVINAPLEKALRVEASHRSASDRELLYSTYLLSTGSNKEAFGDFKKLLAEILECRNGRALTLVTEAWQPVTTRVLPRGNWQDESGEVVQPALPHFLSQPASQEGRRLTRLDLARWLVSPENPLTARTAMNRLWKQFFGTGICSTVDDLGLQGDSPSHPELLDWLAVEFREKGWNMKHMAKVIVMSATYRQDSNLRPELREIDPNNRLLAFQNPRRLEAELVRDNALSIAGLLSDEMGGPSVHPYQPAGYYVNLQFPDRDYYPEKDQRQYRRGVYTHWQRTFLHPMMANFDAPSREECTAIRTVSNTPQQALTLLNDPSFVEAARVFAERILRKQEADEKRIEAAFERALARPAKEKEKASLKQFLAEQRNYYKANKEEAQKLIRVGVAEPAEGFDESELAAWMTLCRVVLNLHESITAY